MNPNNQLLTLGQMILISLALLICGCSSGEIIVEPTTEIKVDSTATSTSNNNALTINTTALEVLTEEEINKIVYDINYLSGCKGNSPAPPERQIDFMGVYAGVTTVDEILSRFGKPTEYRKMNDLKEYYYSDQSSYVHHFFITNEIVDSVAITTDKEILTEVQDILKKYGCPDLVTATAPEPSDLISGDNPDFSVTTFWYLNGGLVITFDGYPIKILDKADVIEFGKPMTLSTFSFDRNTFTPVPFLSALSDP